MGYLGKSFHRSIDRPVIVLGYIVTADKGIDQQNVNPICRDCSDQSLNYRDCNRCPGSPRRRDFDRHVPAGIDEQHSLKLDGVNVMVKRRSRDSALSLVGRIFTIPDPDSQPPVGLIRD
jgi:hypothetical protein